MDPCSDVEVLTDWRERERLRRRLAAGEHAIITQVECRWLPYRHGARSTAALGPRRTVTGMVVGPLFAAVAAAQADGVISQQHAQVIVSAVQKLPATVRHDLHATVEQILLDVAREQHPRFLEQHASELGAYLDPDALGREHAYRDKHRDLRRTRRPDGSAHLSGDLTPDCAEHFHTHLDALSRPRAPTPATTRGSGDDAGRTSHADPGDADPDRAARGRDARTAGQRRHDALLDILTMVERAEQLPNAGGISTTILLTMDADTYTTSTSSTTTGTPTPPGMARTGHRYLVPAHLAKRWAGGDTRIMAVLLSTTKAITAYSSTQRIFTEQQRLALIA